MKNASSAFVTGPSGSGKHELLRTLNREVTPHHGRVPHRRSDIIRCRITRSMCSAANMGIVFPGFRLLFPNGFRQCGVALRVQGVEGRELKRRVFSSPCAMVGMQNRIWTSPPSCPTVSSSASPWPGPWSTTPRKSSWRRPTASRRDLASDILGLFKEINRKADRGHMHPRQELIRRFGGRVVSLQDES